MTSPNISNCGSPAQSHLPGADYEAWRFFCLRSHLPIFSIKDRASYWEGSLVSGPEELARAVSKGYDIGILPERSGLVILDCDVRLTPVQVSENRVDLFEHRGYDDLQRVAESRGKEIPQTYAVQSPSGGAHLYVLQNPAVPVRSKPHRPGWTIDVKASRNVYCVAPRSRGYSVIRDTVPVYLPYWLACHIQRHLPAGYEPRVTVSGPVPQILQDSITGHVANSNVHGGWNIAIFKATCWLRESGMGLPDITSLVLGAAAPRDERERNNAIRTIRSGWNRG